MKSFSYKVIRQLYIIFLLLCLYACKSTEPEPENTTGQAMFWIASDLSCGVITVNIDGETKTISGNNSSSTPDCGDNRSATFDLESGSYDYSASCNGLTWKGSVTVTAGQCYKTKLTGVVNNNQTGQAMFWLASDLGCGNITVNVGGLTKVITGYNNSGAPTCGNNVSATFDLAPGSYSFSTSCNGLTSNGNVTVIAGQCSKTQLTGTVNSNNKGQATFWINSDFGCGNIIVNVGGLSKTITGYNSTMPACGSSGAATFDLVPGTYSYTASCSGKSWNGSVTVTSGQCFRMQLTSSDTNPSTNSGDVVFWSKSDFKCGNISVTCNGITRTLSSYFASGAPSCGASGTATFSFSPGTYSFSAKCTNKTWNGNVVISKGGCSKMELTP